LHQMYVQLYQALIGADATTAWHMFDHAKEAEARVDFLCTKRRQSTYPLEMTEALEKVHAKRTLTAKFGYA
jgi:nicotinic acid mononucleotide adenylyltransferase